jgi:hypothetical protein
MQLLQSQTKYLIGVGPGQPGIREKTDSIKTPKTGCTSIFPVLFLRQARHTSSFTIGFPANRIWMSGLFARWEATQRYGCAVSFRGYSGIIPTRRFFTAWIDSKLKSTDGLPRCLCGPSCFVPVDLSIEDLRDGVYLRCYERSRILDSEAIFIDPVHFEAIEVSLHVHGEYGPGARAHRWHWGPRRSCRRQLMEESVLIKSRLNPFRGDSRNLIFPGVRSKPFDAENPSARISASTSARGTSTSNANAMVEVDSLVFYPVQVGFPPLPNPN